MISKSFDPDAQDYPNGFFHDVTLVEPTNAAAINKVVNPVPGLGWMAKEGWNDLQRVNQSVKILGATEDHRAAKTIRGGKPSDVLVRYPSTPRFH